MAVLLNAVLSTKEDFKKDIIKFFKTIKSFT